MLLQGLLTIAWARLDSFGPSVIMMMVFSVLVQTSIGTCFAIVPYVDGPNTGSVAGIVGAGGMHRMEGWLVCIWFQKRLTCWFVGNVGAIILGLKFRNSDYESSAEYMGWFTIALALLTPLVVVRGYRGLVFGRDDANRRQNTLLIPPAAI
jgi:NNP family nitrate/nitrite transporter-like MFS transporter